MSDYYDDEDHKSSAKAMALFLKLAFNIAILIILYKLLYIPNFPELLRNGPALYIMPIIGTIGAYLYLCFWMGWKNSLYIVGIGGFTIGLAALTSLQTIITLYGLAILAVMGYGLYLFIQLIIRKMFKK